MSTGSYIGPVDENGDPEWRRFDDGNADGDMDMGPSISKPGDYVDLRADTDALTVISNCPQINNPVNDYNPTPVRAIVWQPD